MQKATILATCVLLHFTGAWAQVAVRSVVVHTDDGQIHTYPINQVDSVTFSAEASVQRCKWYQTLENPGIADYLRDFEYDANDYSYHRIFDYRGEPYLDARQDWPYGVTVGDTIYYNLIPNKDYCLQYTTGGNVKTASIHTLGQLRMIRAEGIDNVRDLGGWRVCDGRQVNYGRIFRGTELNTTMSQSNSQLHSSHTLTADDRTLLLDELGIAAELDLRSSAEIPLPGVSALGADVAYANISIDYTNIASASNRQQLVQCLRFINEQLSQGHPIYLHCIWGADRTGVLCMLLEGLLGVGQSDLDKDYELTSFSGNTRYRTNRNYRNALSDVLSQPGTTLQNKFRNWWLAAGATVAELDSFCQLMLIP